MGSQISLALHRKNKKNVIRDGNPVPNQGQMESTVFRITVLQRKLLIYSSKLCRICSMASPSRPRSMKASWSLSENAQIRHKVARIRDVELPNLDRKVIERLFCIMLDRAAGQRLSPCQCAGLKTRDIASHVLRFNPLFEAAVACNVLLLALSTDCTKGFNSMSHSWVVRVLARTR